jgi:hypothetical protein
VRCHSDIKDIRADAHRVPGARAGAKRPLSEPGRSRDAAQRSADLDVVPVGVEDGGDGRVAPG